MPQYPKFQKSIKDILGAHPDHRCYAYLKLYKKTKDFLVCLQGVSGDSLVVSDHLSETKRIPLTDVQWLMDADKTGGDR